MPDGGDVYVQPESGEPGFEFGADGCVNEFDSGRDLHGDRDGDEWDVEPFDECFGDGGGAGGEFHAGRVADVADREAEQQRNDDGDGDGSERIQRIGVVQRERVEAGDFGELQSQVGDRFGIDDVDVQGEQERPDRDVRGESDGDKWVAREFDDGESDYPVSERSCSI